MILPLTNNPEESFRASIYGEIYGFRQLWSEYGYWTIDINDSDNAVLIYGVKLVTKENLLSMYPQIIFDLRSENDNDPTRNNLDVFNLEVIEKDV